MTDDTAENDTPAADHPPIAALEAHPAETSQAAEPAPAAEAQAEGPHTARGGAEEQPVVGGGSAAAPAEELIADAARHEGEAEEHVAAVPEQPTVSELAAVAAPAHELVAGHGHPQAGEVAEEGAEAEHKPASKKPRKSAKTTSGVPEAAAEPTPGEAEPAAEGEVSGEEAAASAPPAEPAPESKKKWYAVKIQSGREESIKAAIERKVKIEGLEQYFGQIVIPVEEVIVKKKVKVKNKKTGETTTQEKNVSKFNKKFPGYLFAEVEFNDEILYVFRETSGVGDFVGVNAKKTQGGFARQPPPPMTDAEVQSMLTGIPDKTKKPGRGGKVVVKLDVEKGDKVRIRNGAFVGSEGEVKSITEPKDPTETPKVTVVVTLWGRPVEVELDYWEVDKV